MCKARVRFRGSVWEVYIWPEELVTVEPNLGQEEICFWAQPTLSLERTALVWNHPFPFQPEFLQARNGNQTPFFTKNLEIPQTHGSNAPPSVSHGWHEIPLYHSSFSLYEPRWILLLFLAHPHAIPCATSLRPSLSRMSQDFFLLGVLQMVSSSLRKPCPWHATQAPWEQKLSRDWVQVSGVLARRLATGTPKSRDLFAWQKVQGCLWESKVLLPLWGAFAGSVWCNENTDLKCQIWTSGRRRQTIISFTLPKKRRIKLPGFSFHGGDAGGRIPPMVSLLAYTRE